MEMGKMHALLSLTLLELYLAGLCHSYATMEELVKYFDEFDQRKIGRRNVMAIAELLLKWDTDRDGRLSYPEFAAYYHELAGFELSMSPSEVRQPRLLHCAPTTRTEQL